MSVNIINNNISNIESHSKSLVNINAARDFSLINNLEKNLEKYIIF